MAIGSRSAVAAQKVRGFLLGFRWVSLALGLLLTMTAPNNLLYPNPPLPGAVIAALLVALEIGMSLFAAKADEMPGNRMVVVIIDMVVGLGLCFAYGMGYFFLAYALPVLEVTYWSGPFMSFVAAIFSGIYSIGFGVQYIIKSVGLRPPGTNGTPLDAGLTMAMVQQIFIYVAATAAIAWVLSTIRHSSNEVMALVKAFREERDVLLEQLDQQRKEMAEVFNLAEERQSRQSDVEEQLTDARDEMEKVYKELHEKTSQIQALQQMSQKKEQQMGQMHKRELEELKAEVDQLHHLLDRVTALVEMTRELHVSVHLDETFLNVLTGALKLVRSQTGILFILDESQPPGELFPEAAAGPYQNFFSNYSFKLGEGAVGWVATQMHPIKIDNENLQVENEILSSLVNYEKSALIVPLANGDRPMGVLYLGRPDPNAFTDEELEDLLEFCKHSSLSIANATEYQKAMASGINDEVTGLKNHMYFHERLREEAQRAKRYHWSLALMLLDIDSFSDYNDAFGHERGSALMKELGEILGEHTRETDVSARLKDDLFGVLLVQSEKSDAIMIGDRIRMAMQMRSMARAGKNKPLSVSLGIASMPKDAKDAVELFQLAENALEDAKKDGGNKSAWAS